MTKYSRQVSGFNIIYNLHAKFLFHFDNYFFAFNATIVIASDFIQIFIYHFHFETSFKIGPIINFWDQFTPLVSYSR